MHDWMSWKDKQKVETMWEELKGFRRNIGGTIKRRWRG